MREYILSIAGIDPTAGAGLLSDVKTFEQCGVYGMAISSGNTNQTDSKFYSVAWQDITLIEEQIVTLFSSYNFSVVKIGLIESLDVLLRVVTLLIEQNPDIKICWDPILKASAGFRFHTAISRDILNSILSKIWLITPNLQEAEELFAEEVLKFKVAPPCYLLIKGGHSKIPGRDTLIDKRGRVTIIDGDSFNGLSKHGTGCVLSAAISAAKVKGESTIESAKEGKRYVERFILSNNSNLGYHNIKEREVKNISKLQVITQHLLHRSEEEQAEEALKGGADWIQLRIKGERQAQWREIALRVKEVTDRYGASLIINDNPQLALEIGASGVHLGGEDSSIKDARKLLGSDIIIGGTANSFADIVSLTDAGVDYIGLGPFRFTTTKDNLSPIIGIEGYQDIAKQMRLEGITTPVVAIGGITIADIRNILDQGVYGIAVSGEVVNAVSPLEQSRNFLKEINR